MYDVNFYSHHMQDDWTALHYAANEGRTEVVNYLLDNANTQVNAKDIVSQCLLFVCAK